MVISGTVNGPMETFLNANFSNITSLKSGDYSNFIGNPAQQADIAAADVVIIARILSSAAYSDAARSAAWNAISVPVVSFTSYVTRPDGNRFGWESGGTNNMFSSTGLETTITAAGAAVFGGVANSTVNWYEGDAVFNAVGTGTVGGGQILATLGGGTLAAHWSAGAASAGGVIFPADRLLFNLGDTGGIVFPNAAGTAAMIRAIDAYTPLTPVPEPTAALSAAAGLGMLALRRRRR